MPGIIFSWSLKGFAFVLSSTGSEYGIGRFQKITILIQISRNFLFIKGGVSWIQLVFLFEEILRIPKSVNGSVVECGSWHGLSTATLSLACKLTDRKLFVCDSFEGLPEPEQYGKHAIHGHVDEFSALNENYSLKYYIWEQGEYACSLEMVKNNVKQFGDITCCEFIKGYFEKTLLNLKTDSIAMIFEDADLASSVRDCLVNLWPKLVYGGKFFSHEPWSIEVVSCFYDRKWWKDCFNSPPPGFYGSGKGIILGGAYSMLGYSRKFDYQKIKANGTKKPV